jgi:hypothetical protein
MSVTLTPTAAVYTKHAAVASTTANACFDQLEQELIAARNVGNSQRVHRALRDLASLVRSFRELHL